MAMMRPFSDFRQQFNQMFQDLEELAFPAMREQKPLSLSQGGRWIPAIEMAETERDYIVKAQVPGVSPKDLDVEVTDSSLILRGETRQERETENTDIYRSEICYGQFYRQIPLPGPVDEKSIDAQFKNGMLEVRMPKTHESKRKRIEIKQQ
jgi:HSP20 family protein